MNGYVMFFRSSLNHRYFTNVKLWHFYQYCILKASRFPTKAMVGHQEIELGVGEFVFGRKQASEETGLSEQEIRTILTTLLRESKITQKSTNKFSIITVINYSSWQTQYQEINQQLTSKQPTNNQQITTYNKVKNVKNNKKAIVAKQPSGDHQLFIAWWSMAFKKLFGQPPTIDKKAAAQIQTMLKSVQDVRWLVVYASVLLTTEDAFYDKAGRTLGTLQGGLDKFKSCKPEYNIDLWREIGIAPPEGVQFNDWSFWETA